MWRAHAYRQRPRQGRFPMAPKANRRSANDSQKRGPAKKDSKRYWSGEVTRKSNALDLEKSVFRGRSARGIAQSLKRSAVASKRRKAEPFQSAMSMLNFYMNRAGKNLPKERKHVLEQAKGELRKLFHKAA